MPKRVKRLVLFEYVFDIMIVLIIEYNILNCNIIFIFKDINQ